MAQQDTYFGRITQLRQKFRREPEQDSWFSSPRRLLRFLELAVKKAQADELTQQAAALAFITLVSLIPLLSTFSLIGARAFRDQNVQQRLLELLTQVLPYSEEKLLGTLQTFLENAHTVSGFGFVIFLATALMAFSSIEQTINRVWNVPHRRPFRVRLLSFTLLLFWGSLVIGAMSSGLFFLRKVEIFERFSRSLPAQFLPSLITLIGLTMLYWLVPYTKVAFRSALGGGILATILLEVLRQGFGFYIAQATSVWIIYSSLGLVFFFMISVQLSWWAILLGSEVAYCVEHHAILLRERRPAAAPEGSWLGLVALVVLAERLRNGRPITPHELLADQLRIPSAELPGVLEPLLTEGLIHETRGDTDGLLLACDPHQLKLTKVFELYERDHWEVLEPLSDEIVPQLERLRVRLTEVRDERARETVLASLLAPVEPPPEEADPP